VHTGRPSPANALADTVAFGFGERTGDVTAKGDQKQLECGQVTEGLP
jgi:hypothetical protein